MGMINNIQFVTAVDSPRKSMVGESDHRSRKGFNRIYDHVKPSSVLEPFKHIALDNLISFKCTMKVFKYISVTP